MSKHSLTAIAEIWGLVSESIQEEEKESLAENVVGILIDHDYALEDIRYEFEGDISILNAVKYYSNDESWTDEFDEEYTDEYNDYDEDE